MIVNRPASGEFAIAARVNGARVTFLFDTGASAVVLTASDARRAGVNAAGLAFDVPVTTANGPALAAEVRLDEIAVGPIVMRNVRALVARPGALEESLLGMSFLERLHGYAVERDRLDPDGEVRREANRSPPGAHRRGRRAPPQPGGHQGPRRGERPRSPGCADRPARPGGLKNRPSRCRV